jgi:hypothetical protein
VCQKLDSPHKHSSLKDSLASSEVLFNLGEPSLIRNLTLIKDNTKSKKVGLGFDDTLLCMIPERIWNRNMRSKV